MSAELSGERSEGLLEVLSGGVSGFKDVREDVKKDVSRAISKAIRGAVGRSVEKDVRSCQERAVMRELPGNQTSYQGGSE